MGSGQSGAKMGSGQSGAMMGLVNRDHNGF